MVEPLGSPRALRCSPIPSAWLVNRHPNHDRERDTVTCRLATLCRYSRDLTDLKRSDLQLKELSMSREVSSDYYIQINFSNITATLYQSIGAPRKYPESYLNEVY